MNNKKRILLFTLILSIFTISVSAQGFTGSQDPIGNFFQGFNDQIDWYEGEGIPAFILWVVVPALGFFAIFNFIYTKAFDFAESNFRRNTDRRHSELSDMADKMATLLAASTSIVSLIMWGGALGWVMLVAGGAGIVWFVWANAAGLRGTVLGDSGSPIPFGGNGENETDEELDEVDEELDTTASEETDEEERIEQTTAEVQSGNADPSEVTNEIDVEVNELEDIVNKLEVIEGDIELIESSLESEEERVQSEEEKQEQEIKDVKDLETKIERISDVLVNLTSKISNDNLGPQGLAEALSEQGFEAQGNPENLDNVMSQLERNLENDITALTEFEEVLEMETDKRYRLNHLETDISRLKEEVQQLKEEINEVELIEQNLENAENGAEKLAEKYNDTTDLERIRADEKETSQVAQEIRETVLAKLNNLEGELDYLVREVKNHERFDDEELEQIKVEAQEIEEIRSQMRQIEDVLGDDNSLAKALGEGKGDISSENFGERILGMAQLADRKLGNIAAIARETLEEVENNEQGNFTASESF